MELTFVFFGVYLFLCTTVVLIERKRGVDWRKIANRPRGLLRGAALHGLRSGTGTNLSAARNRIRRRAGGAGDETGTPRNRFHGDYNSPLKTRCNMV